MACWRPPLRTNCFGLPWPMVCRKQDAVEAVQEALLRAFAGLQTWRQGADAMAWLCGFVVNISRERHRQRRRRTALPLDECLGEVCSSEDPPGDAWEPEQLQQLMKAIAELPPRQREAIACRYLRRMSIRQAAQVMGCAEGTVKSAVSAAIDRLGKYCKRCHDQQRFGTRRKRCPRQLVGGPGTACPPARCPTVSAASLVGRGGAMSSASRQARRPRVNDHQRAYRNGACRRLHCRRRDRRAS